MGKGWLNDTLLCYEKNFDQYLAGICKVAYNS